MNTIFAWLNFVAICLGRVEDLSIPRTIGQEQKLKGGKRCLEYWR